MQPIGILVVGGSNPGLATGVAAGGDAKSKQIRIRTDARRPGIGCVTIGQLAVLLTP